MDDVRSGDRARCVADDGARCAIGDRRCPRVAVVLVAALGAATVRSAASPPTIPSWADVAGREARAKPPPRRSSRSIKAAIAAAAGRGRSHAGRGRAARRRLREGAAGLRRAGHRHPEAPGAAGRRGPGARPTRPSASRRSCSPSSRKQRRRRPDQRACSTRSRDADELLYRLGAMRQGHRAHATPSTRRRCRSRTPRRRSPIRPTVAQTKLDELKADAEAAFQVAQAAAAGRRPEVRRAAGGDQAKARGAARGAHRAARGDGGRLPRGRARASGAPAPRGEVSAQRLGAPGRAATSRARSACATTRSTASGSCTPAPTSPGRAAAPRSTRRTPAPSSTPAGTARCGNYIQIDHGDGTGSGYGHITRAASPCASARRSDPASRSRKVGTTGGVDRLPPALHRPRQRRHSPTRCRSCATRGSPLADQKGPGRLMSRRSAAGQAAAAAVSIAAAFALIATGGMPRDGRARAPTTRPGRTCRRRSRTRRPRRPRSRRSRSS